MAQTRISRTLRHTVARLQIMLTLSRERFDSRRLRDLDLRVVANRTDGAV